MTRCYWSRTVRRASPMRGACCTPTPRCCARSDRFADVAVGLLNGTPSAAEALAALAPHVVHVVPFFMEQGWFVREAIPRALGDGQRPRAALS